MRLNQHHQKMKNNPKETRRMKKIIIPALLLVLAVPASAQQLGNSDVPHTISETIGGMGDTLLYIILSISLLMLFLVTVVYFSIARLRDKILGETDPIYATRAKQSFWARVFGIDPIEEDKTKILDHNYDGIHELNNPIPAWFMWLFYGSVVAAVMYMFNYHVFNLGKLQEAEYTAEMKQAEIDYQVYLKTAGDKINTETVTALTDEKDLNKGKELFMKMGACASCHKDDGGGSIGPNLTDEFWKHGGGIKNVFKIISEGVPNTAMKSWKKDYSTIELQQIASFVISLKGSNPPDAKEPEGEKWREEAPPTQNTDTTSMELSMK